MRCVADPDLATFADHALPHLHRDPVRHNIACNAVEARLHGWVPVEPDALWLRVLDGDGRVVTAAVRTPPFPLLLTSAPEPAVDALVDTLRERVPDLPGVNGSAPLTERFARRWSAASGVAPEIARRSRMFRMAAPTPPSGVPGRLRPATGDDRALLAAWLTAFQDEAVPDGPRTDPGPVVDRGLERGDAWWLWEAAGEPVSMLQVTRPAAGVVRVNAVYTPPARRGNGYASACVAAATRWALDHRAEACMLYTDLANPTSNKIYQAIGYRPVGDFTEWRLRPPTLAAG